MHKFALTLTFLFCLGESQLGGDNPKIQSIEDLLFWVLATLRILQARIDAPIIYQEDTIVWRNYNWD